MLSQITIQNFGLIDRISLELSAQLNVLTGETGAGKSIVIDALRFVLGDRLSATQIRDPQLPCVVEAAFELTQKDVRSLPVFSDYLQPQENELIIHRTHLPDGKNKIKVNGFLVTVAQLREIGNHLVDFHGPHDHQQLLSDDSHIRIVDKLSDFGGAKEKYETLYSEYSRLNKEIEELAELGQTRVRDLDLLSHQVNELEQVPLDSTTHEELINEQLKLNNSEKLFECVQNLLEVLENDDSGLSDQIRRLFPFMRTLNQIDDQTLPFAQTLEQIQENAQSLTSELTHYSESLSFEPEQAREINRRCDLYDEIKRKYGPTLEEALKFYEEAKRKRDLLQNFEESDSDLKLRLQEKEKELRTLAQKLTKERQKTALLLQKTIEKELSELGILHVQFECRIEKGELRSSGQDKVTFFISPNAGEALKPLSQIVSSGEAARLMLALKKALIKVDPIPVLIFDEIDAQIGGRLGTVTGTKLKEISRKRQVILITHLPQIASFGDFHFKVTKEVKNNRAVTNVQRLEENFRIKELAKMMSGEKESSISVTHAQEMFEKAQAVAG